jgi:hypothetical protein
MTYVPHPVAIYGALRKKNLRILPIEHCQKNSIVQILKFSKSLTKSHLKHFSFVRREQWTVDQVDLFIGDQNAGSMLHMMTIFSDFWQFSAIFDNIQRFLPFFWQQMAFFLINQCYDKTFAKKLNYIVVVWAKQAPIFSPTFFRENIFYIITSVPDN